MQIARTEEQQELANIVTSLLTKRSDSDAVRRAMASEVGYDEELWQALCEQVGVAALCIPEEYDGFGSSLVETGVALEALGVNLAPAPLLTSAAAAAALILYADEDAKSDLLPQIAAGQTATIFINDDANSPQLVLEGQAGILLRVVGDQLNLVTDAQVDAVEALDQTLRFARISGGSNNPIGSGVDIEALQAITAALATTLQVGGAQRGLEMTVDYAKVREHLAARSAPSKLSSTAWQTCWCWSSRLDLPPGARAMLPRHT